MLASLIIAIWALVVIAVVLGIVFLDRPADSPGITPPTTQPTSWLESVTARKLIVHTTDDHSMEGLLVHTGPDGLLLDHAKLLGDKPVDLGGRIWIDRDKVLMVQTIPVP